MPDSPLPDAQGIVTIDVFSNGTLIPGSFEIISIFTRSNLNQVAEALIVVNDGDPSSSNFPVADSNYFEPGASVEIKAGYEHQNKTIFKGVVTAVRMRVKDVKTSRIEVTCRHQAAVLLQGRRRAVYSAGKTDSDLLEQIISDAGLSVEIESTRVTLPETVRIDVSDWDFIVSRAELNGMFVMCTDEGLSVSKPDFDAPALLEITYGTDLIAFDMEVSAYGQFPSFEASAWDPARQSSNSISAKGTSNNLYGNLKSSELVDVLDPKEVGISSSAFHDTAALNAYVAARASRADLAVAQGSVTFRGNAKPKPNTVLTLKGLGDSFSGDGLVGGVEHRIGDGSWETDVQFGLPADWVSDQAGFEAPAASALATGTQGLVIGKVTQLEGDPAGLSRIQIAIPEFDRGATPVWARLGSTYASNAAGIMFLPELDDEVVVGFLNDNPSAPVILGALHSPKARPPEGFEGYDDNNHIKAIISREQLKITFDEDSRILSLETPGGNNIRLDDEAGSIELEDQHKNKITMNSSGIVLDSTGDIVIKADGDVEIEAGRRVNIAGRSDFKASGGASAELSSDGVTEVKGSLVQIN